MTPANSRRAASNDLGGRITPRVWPAIEAYHEVARCHGLDPVQMAIAWARGRPFMGSVIVGASSADQLERILGAADLELDGDVLGDIAQVHKAYPMPF